MKIPTKTISLSLTFLFVLLAGYTHANSPLQHTRINHRKILSSNSAMHSDSTPATRDEYTGFLVSKAGAWCWFADPRALHYENEAGTINSTYIGYIDVHGNIKASQYNFITGKSNEVLVRSWFQPDDHNSPSFLVLPDERIMIFYSRHTDEACFYYRISEKAGDITALRPEMKIPTTHNTTYPSPFFLSSDPKHFYLCWRGINWHPTLARYTLPDSADRVNLDWGPYQMIQSTAARPYCKYYSNDSDRIYLAYTTGHPDNEYPNYIYFNYIDIHTLQLKDVSGKVLSTIANGPHNVNKTDYPSIHAEAVVDSPADQRDWIWQTTLDNDGLPVIAMVQISEDKATHNYYYARWTGKTWRKTFLANGGGHFHQSDGIELCYSGGMTIDDSNPDIVYCSVPVTGASGEVYEIMKYTVADDGSVVSKEQITSNSTLNNVRPYIIAHSGSSPLKLVWMYGNYYDWIVSSSHPEGFPTEIHCDFAFPAGPVDLKKRLIVEEDFTDSVSGTVAKAHGIPVCRDSTSETLTNIHSGSFSVSLTFCIQESSYEGEIFRMGNLVYGLNGATLKPYITVGDITWTSTNLLGNSDGWQSQNRATDGQWWPPVMLKYFNLTITCEEILIKVYRNGLIDQVLEAKNFVPGEVIPGEFNVQIGNCRIYDRSLNQEEIKKLTEISLKDGYDKKSN